MVEANEKRKRKDAKIHKKEQVTKDKKYSQLIKTSVAKHSKIISGLRLDVHQSEVKVNVATVRYQSLKRAYNVILDASKIKHRASLRKQQVLHAQHIQKKNKMLKKMWVDVEGTREMLCEMLAEMNELKWSVKVASTSADKASASKQKAAMKA